MEPKIEYWELADKAIQRAYPDIWNKGRGWWGDKRIPNYGILRGAIVRALMESHNALRSTGC